MAFDVYAPDDFLKELELTDELATEMIDEALPIYQKEIQKALEPHRKNGDLINSVKKKKAKKAKNGAYIGNITFDGKDRKGTPNIVKALVLDRRYPFMLKAKINAEQKAMDKMQEVYNTRVVGK